MTETPEETPWPVGQPSGGRGLRPIPPRSSLPRFPWLWVMLIGGVFAVERLLTVGARADESAAYNAGRYAGTAVGAMLVPIVVAGVAWLLSKRRDLTIGLAAAVVATTTVAPLLRSGSAAREFEAAMIERLRELDRDLQGLGEGGGIDPATLEGDGKAAEQQRVFRAFAERARALRDDLDSGDAFGPSLSGEKRDRAWADVKKARWWRDSRRLVEVESRFFEVCEEYAAALAEQEGHWTLTDDVVMFDESVPDEFVDRYNDCIERLQGVAGELEQAARMIEGGR